jgi:hypothetical protein
MGPYSILYLRKLEKEIAQITVSHGCTLYDFTDLQGYTPGKLAKFPFDFSTYRKHHASHFREAVENKITEIAILAKSFDSCFIFRYFRIQL